MILAKWLTCVLFFSSLTFLGGQSNALPHTHSHNDYLHHRPLFEALENGFISVEADILFRDGQLYVGHDKIDLENKPLRLFEATYLQPLFERFQSQDGLLYHDYNELFYLWIDIKYAGADVFMALQKMILPYQEMLYSGHKNKNGKVMLLISGDRPMELLLADTSGYFHVDGRPADLEKNIKSGTMPFISEHFRKICQPNSAQSLDPEEWQKVKNLVVKCHQQQKKVRLWATPENEVLWSQLLKAKLDLINTDSLAKLALFIRAQ